MNERIENLTRSKPFSELSFEEREWVLAEMSAETYDQMHKVLMSAANLHADTQPPAYLRARLMKQVRPATRHFPVWQAAAMLALGFGMAWLVKPSVAQIAVKTEVQTQIDTVWREKIVFEEKIKYRTKIVYQTIAAANPNVPDSVIWAPIKTPLETAPINPHVGASLNDTPQLMEFFTKAK